MDQLNISLRNKESAPPETAPLMALRNQVIFPFNLTPVMVFEEGMAACELAMSRNRLIALFPEMPSEEDFAASPEVQGKFEHFSYQNRQLFRIGTLCRIIKKLNFPDGSTRILVRGVSRINLVKLELDDAMPIAAYEKMAETVENPMEAKALQKSIINQFQELSSMLPGMPDEFKIAVLNLDSPGRLSDLLVDAIQLNYPEKIMLLGCASAQQRLYLLSVLINRNLEVMRLGAKIQSEVHSNMSKSQRDYYLQEQLRTIKRELGEDARNPDIIELEKRIMEQELPEKVLQTVQKEMSRLEVLPQASPEYHVSYNYLDTILSLPWNVCTEDRLDVKEAEAVLDEDHYGLADVKERILEFLSVLQLKKDRKSPILCLVGPPGVGKTSLGQSIARALNRQFIRMALGGVRDEAEIRGHRRTYIGAMPGRIIQNLRKVGSANPVFMLDEIDKLNRDFRGDPASALLEVLDGEQNTKFSDHYLELDFDLSRVFFIATANTLDTIPEPLLDRMEVIRLPGYTSFEKREIAKRYLVKRGIRDNGLKSSQIRFNVSAINELIDYYTREAGVRELDRVISQCCRKIARKIVEGELKSDECVGLNPAWAEKLLGGHKYLLEEARPPDVGCATGMAWTSAGGVILMVETVKVPGKGNLKLTGSLGKVMQESAEAAFTYIRSCAGKWNIDPKVFEQNDFHIHVPDGATPKDGPSAGITIATALLSLLTGQKGRALLSMTGEINLRGNITAIGGVKEKVIAALRAGVKEIILPQENKKDLEDIPQEVQKQLAFHFVSRFEQAAKLVFEERKK